MKLKMSSILSLMLLSIALPVAAQEQKGVEIRISEPELQEIYSNPKRSYVYVGPEATPIAAIMQELSKFDENPNSLVRGLAEHTSKGFVIGNYDAVAQALEEAELVLAAHADEIGEEKAEAIANSLDTIIEQVIEEKLTLDAEMLSFLQDSLPATEDATKGCCKPRPHCHGLRLLVIKEKLDVLGKAKFRDDVTFKDDVKFEDEATFEDEVTFEDNVFIEGTLSVADQVVGCDLTVGCNINMNTSTSAAVGNIIKGGAPFMHDFGSNSTFLGTNAGNFTNTGLNNTGLGFNALSVNATGGSNTAVGFAALQLNVAGNNNTAVGTSALQNNLADNNTALGSGSLNQNTTGINNTALGTATLNVNTTGANNTAVGTAALNLNTIGFQNTAVGAAAGQNTTTGSFNTVVGFSSLQANTIGAANTALGFSSLAISTGNFNTAVGNGAGSLLVTGDNNLYIANVGTAVESNTTRVGTSGLQTRSFISGVRGVATGIANAIPVLIDSADQLGTVSSSIRFKHNVQDMADASAKLYDLRSVTFEYNNDVTNSTQFGFIAEEVAQVFPEIVVYEDGQPYSVQYHVLPQLIINELQKLAARVAALEARQ